jgi:hypothetical protein
MVLGVTTVLLYNLRGTGAIYLEGTAGRDKRETGGGILPIVI